ncbi:MAG: TolC family protein [Bacteroidetes bacterium]|nr:TolC family protein [Bacteroidota bacterium]
MRKALILSFVSLLIILKVTSQNNKLGFDSLKISLNDIWKKALSNSRLIKIKNSEIEISSEEVNDVILERLPEMGISGSYERATNIPIYDKGLFSPPSYHEVIKNLYRVSGDLYQTIYNGNKLNLKIKEEKVKHHIKKIELEEAISSIKYKAAALYLELQQVFIFRNVVKDDISDQEKQLTEIKSMHKYGTTLKSDVLRIELELSKRKLLLVKIENDILITSQKLNIIIGEPDERVIVPDELKQDVETAESNYDQFLKQALDYSYIYNISEQKTELSKLHLKQVKANIRPKLGLTGDFYYMNPQIFLFPYNPYWYSLGLAGLKASFPISSFYHNIHKTKAARLELEKEEETHRDTEDKVRQQLKEAFLRFKESLIQIDVAKVNEAQANENARIIKDNYFNQTALVTDLLDANIQVLQTKFELASAKIASQNKYYLLLNIAGKL